MIKVACIHPQSITLPEAANQLTYTPRIDGMISHILANLTATYTNMCVSINTDSSKWVFNNAGGVMGAMR
ncbi:hypothetical protein V8E52_007499 [Russula decolorans]